jgi:hypothetical protein
MERKGQKFFFSLAESLFKIDCFKLQTYHIPRKRFSVLLCLFSLSVSKNLILFFQQEKMFAENLDRSIILIKALCI